MIKKRWEKDPWGRGYPLGLRTQGRGFDSRWVRWYFFIITDSGDAGFFTVPAYTKKTGIKKRSDFVASSRRMVGRSPANDPENNDNDDDHKNAKPDHGEEARVDILLKRDSQR